MGSTPTQRLTARAPKRSVVFFNHTIESVGNWLRNCQSRLKLPAGHAPCNGTIGMRRRPEATKTPMAMTQWRKYPPTVSGRQTRSLVGLGRAGSPRTASGGTCSPSCARIHLPPAHATTRTQSQYAIVPRGPQPWAATTAGLGLPDASTSSQPFALIRQKI